MSKLTQRNVNRLTLPEQANEFFADNQISTPEHGPGPSLMSQVNFWNDWKTTLRDWRESLPLK